MSYYDEVKSVFNAYAVEGRATWSPEPGAQQGPARLSHICLKFTSLAAYTAAVDEARALGRVTHEQFKGKEITWCRLTQPLEDWGQRLEWLELVEPKLEQASRDGVANIGYAVEGLPAAVKKPSFDGRMTFRYQGQHARDMAPSV